MLKWNGRLLLGSLSGRTLQQQSVVLQASHRHEKWRIALHYLLVNLFSAVLPGGTALIIIIQEIKFNLCGLVSVNNLLGISLQQPLPSSAIKLHRQGNFHNLRHLESFGDGSAEIKLPHPGTSTFSKTIRGWRYLHETKNKNTKGGLGQSKPHQPGKH